MNYHKEITKYLTRVSKDDFVEMIGRQVFDSRSGLWFIIEDVYLSFINKKVVGILTSDEYDCYDTYGEEELNEIEFYCQGGGG